MVPKRGLDFVDRGQHLPGDPVFGSAGLVDRQQEGRDLEGVDDEVGDADRGRAEGRDRRRRVRRGRGCRRRRTGSRRRPPSASGWSPPPVALGALTPPSEPPPPLASPRLSLRVTPPLHPCRRGRCRRSRCPARRPAPFFVAGVAAGASGVGTGVAGPAPLGGAGASLVSVGSVQSGSARSMRPSPSSSRPLAQAGACSEGTAVVVVAGPSAAVAFGHAVRLRPCRRQGRQRQEAGEYDGKCELCSHPNAPRYPLPRIAETAKTASAPSPRDRRAEATRSPRDAQRPGAAPQQGLNQHWCHS